MAISTSMMMNTDPYQNRYEQDVMHEMRQRERRAYDDGLNRGMNASLNRLPPPSFVEYPSGVNITPTALQPSPKKVLLLCN